MPMTCSAARQTSRAPAAPLRYLNLIIAVGGALALSACRAPVRERAIYFNGITDHVVIARSPQIEPLKALTVEFWFKPEGAYEGELARDLVRKCGPWESGYMFRWHTPGRSDCIWLLSKFRNKRPIGEAKVISKTLPRDLIGAWRHFAATYSAADGQALLFIDGHLVGQRAADFQLEHTGNLYLMYQPNTAIQGAVAGTLREFRLSNIARYRQPFDPPWRLVPDANALIHLRMDEGSGNELFDLSHNHHHAKLVGGRWVPLKRPTRLPPEP